MSSTPSMASQATNSASFLKQLAATASLKCRCISLFKRRSAERQEPGSSSTCQTEAIQQNAMASADALFFPRIGGLKHRANAAVNPNLLPGSPGLRDFWSFGECQFPFPIRCTTHFRRRPRPLISPPRRQVARLPHLPGRK